VAHKVKGSFYQLRTGLKFSNYVIGKVEFTRDRANSMLASAQFDCVLFEYWHAVDSVAVFQSRGIPCVLDMHNVLWQAYLQQLDGVRDRVQWLKRWTTDRYRVREERAWSRFDGVIAINQEELGYVRERIPQTTKLFYAPMGTDLSLWPYSWEPSEPPRVAYYGGLGTLHNQQAALQCAQEIMPEIWRSYPQAELWIVGSHPPEHVRALASSDPRIRVTGFVEDVQQVLRTMTLVLCPWYGTYGFRSRLIEVMALGVPVVATPDATYGMGLGHGSGILFGQESRGLSEQALDLLRNRDYAAQQSRLARQQMEQFFSLDVTYRKLMSDLASWLQPRANHP
jgi:glycosyltransferase involved in cell wall biosynthesis